jgi:hypothetical protein
MPAARVAPAEWVSKVAEIADHEDRRRSLAHDEYRFIENGGHLALAVARVTRLLDTIGRQWDDTSSGH